MGAKKCQNAYEAALYYQELMRSGMDVKKIATEVGKVPMHVYQHMKLLESGPKLREALIDKLVSVAKAVGIINKAGSDVKKQDELLSTIIRRKVGKLCDFSGTIVAIKRDFKKIDNVGDKNEIISQLNEINAIVEQAKKSLEENKE